MHNTFTVNFSSNPVSKSSTEKYFSSFGPHLSHLSHLSHLVPGSSVRIMIFDFSSAFNTIQPALLGDKLELTGVDQHPGALLDRISVPEKKINQSINQIKRPHGENSPRGFYVVAYRTSSSHKCNIVTRS